MNNRVKFELKELIKLERIDKNDFISKNLEYKINIDPKTGYIKSTEDHEKLLRENNIEIDWFDDKAQLIQNGIIYLVDIYHRPEGILFNYNELEMV